MWPLVIASLTSALLSFGSAWQIQSWRHDAEEKHRVEQEAAQALSAQRDLRALENRRYTAAASAQVAAAARDTELRRDAAGSRDALVGLSHATDQALREAGASHAACTERAATLGELLAASTKEYRDLGEKASRHVSDIKTLTDTWPKE